MRQVYDAGPEAVIALVTRLLAQHLRELTFLAEEGGLLWAQAMKRLLQNIKAAVGQAEEQGHAGLAPPVRCGFEERYAALLQQGQRERPPAPRTGKRGRAKQSAGRNLIERLSAHRTAVLAGAFSSFLATKVAVTSSQSHPTKASAFADSEVCIKLRRQVLCFCCRDFSRQEEN